MPIARSSAMQSDCLQAHQTDFAGVFVIKFGFHPDFWRLTTQAAVLGQKLF